MPLCEAPTATQKLWPQDTPERTLDAPATFGLAVIDQAVPFQVSISVCFVVPSSL